jgi:ATP-dependent metalloprotease FtsH
MTQNKNSKGGNKKSPFSIYWVYAILGIAIFAYQFYYSQSSRIPLKTISQFETLGKEGYVDDVAIIINKTRADIRLNEEGIKYLKNTDDKNFQSVKKALKLQAKNNRSNSTYIFELKYTDNGNFENKVEEINKYLKENDKKEIPYVSDMEYDYLMNIISFLLPIVLIFGLWMFIMRRMSGGGGGGPGGQIFNIGKSRAQVYDNGKTTNVTFKDVAGLQGAKEEVVEIVEFLKNPKRYTDLGAKIPKGALLVGPPGTGKTLLAKAVAGEAKVPFFSLSGSDFVEMFVGVGASRVRDLFKQAKEKSPAIIFIDEIDAIGRARGKNGGFSSNDERENTLNQLLTEMDGFGTNSGVIILAATNRADILDKALVRAGRFDRQIYVDMPDINERKEIFQVHLKPLKLANDIDIDFLSKQTPGFSGADIANLCNEAALIAARKDKKEVEKQDFLDAVDRIIGGLEKKTKIITKEEKRAIAFHEAGHATISWLLEHAHPLVKVTIVPRGQSLGAAWYLPEERSITTTEQLLDDMCSALGGRAAEQITFGKISTGALSDLEKVTKQAYAMVSVYGLNDKIGNISFYDSQGRESFQKPYSEDTARIIDEEVSKIIESQYQRAIQLLTEHKEQLGQLAEKLLTEEVIFKEDLEQIFGKRPWDKEHIQEDLQHVTIAEEVVEEKQAEVSNDSSNDTPTDSKVEQNEQNLQADETSEEVVAD